MFTITVDDKQPIVNMMNRLLTRLDPEGSHQGFVDAMEALAMVKRQPVDVAFLDVDMPGMNGIELAKRIQSIRPLCNIIFITGYQEYMPEAFSLYASGYILKPVTEPAVKEALAHLRYRTPSVSTSRIQVRCFGSFEVFVDGRPVHFGRSKSKELFAYLIDRRGAVCTPEMVIGNLWPDEPFDEAVKGKNRVVTSDMVAAFTALGAESVIVRGVGGVAVDQRRVDCDYFRFLEGDAYAIHAYTGEYMTQYDFAEETRMHLLQKFHRDQSL
ncbi:MAG: response regulator [Lachnospiraceae bacterium]|nr:response regulator [Lachnospiraceae bacterium]